MGLEISRVTLHIAEFTFWIFIDFAFLVDNKWPSQAELIDRIQDSRPDRLLAHMRWPLLDPLSEKVPNSSPLFVIAPAFVTVAASRP